VVSGKTSGWGDEKLLMEYGRVTDRELESIRKIVGSERMSVGESILDLHGKDA
jgi:hypothetical protein